MHEIRSRLTVLSGYLSMLEDGSLGPLPEPARSALPPMRSKTQAIFRLVDDMLEDARQRDGRLHLAVRLVDVRGVVRAVADDARLDLADGHHLNVEVPEVAVMANVDPRRLATIVRNLIDNAINYSPDGGPVDCQLEIVDDQALITVRDRGVGFDAGDADRLFERFERGRNSGVGSVEGIGLGLYISRTLARLHDGDITAIARPGGGAEFSVRLPLAPAAADH